MKKCERTMNRPGICKTQRIKAIHKFHEYRNILLARDYCLQTKPQKQLIRWPLLTAQYQRKALAAVGQRLWPSGKNNPGAELRAMASTSGGENRRQRPLM